MAVVQLRHRDSEGRACYDRKAAAGKTPMEAMRSLKRRLSDIVYHQMIPGRTDSGNGPGRTRGGGYWLQRGRLQPQHRHFGEVTSRARHHRRYARPGKPGDPFSPPFPPPPGQRRPAAAVKRSLLDRGEARRKLEGGQQRPS